MRRITTLLVLAGGIALQPALASAQQGAAQDQASIDLPQWKVSVVEKGENARRLRYDPKMGETQVIDMRTGMEISGEVNGQPMGMPMSLTTTATYAVRPQEKQDNAIEFVGEFVDMGAVADGPMGQQMRSMLQGLIGTKVHGRVDARGQAKQMRLEMPGGAAPQLEEQVRQIVHSVNQLAVIFPEEPIGVGGRWRVEGEMDMQNIELDQTTEYTLISIEGDRARVGIKTRQQAGQQTVESPQAPGQQMELDSLEGTTEGVIVVDLARLAPVEATSESTLTIVMRTEQMGQEMEMTQRMRADTSIEPGELPEEDEPGEGEGG